MAAGDDRRVYCGARTGCGGRSRLDRRFDK